MDHLHYMSLNFFVSLTFQIIYFLSSEFLHVNYPFFVIAIIAQVLVVHFVLEYAKFRIAYDPTYLRPSCMALLVAYVALFVWAGFVPFIKTFYQTYLYFFPVGVVYFCISFVYFRTVLLFRQRDEPENYSQV